jgi:hypothetical protein
LRPEIGPRTHYRKNIIRLPPTSASSGFHPHRRHFYFWSAICFAVVAAIFSSATPDPAPRPATPHGKQITNYFVDFNLPGTVPLSPPGWDTNLFEIFGKVLGNNNTKMRGKPAPQEPFCFYDFSEDISSQSMPAPASFHVNRPELESTNLGEQNVNLWSPLDRSDRLKDYFSETIISVHASSALGRLDPFCANFFHRKSVSESGEKTRPDGVAARRFGPARGLLFQQKYSRTCQLHSGPL